MWFGVGIGVTDKKPDVEMDHYCKTCDVRWRAKRSQPECWICGDPESKNLTTSGEANIVGKHGNINVHGAMVGRPSAATEEEE